MAVTLTPRFADVRDRTRPYLLLAGLQVLDVALTWFILASWSARAEGNPLVSHGITTLGLPAAMMLVLAFKLGVVWLFYLCQTKVRLVSALYGLVIFNNLLFLGLWAFG